MAIDPGLLNLIRSNSAKVNSVDLSGQKLSDEDVHELATALSRNNVVKHLDLSGCDLSPKACGYLSSIRVTDLVMHHNPQIGPDGAGEIAKISTLRSLDIGYCGIKDEGLAHFVEVPLVSLNSDFNQITAVGARAIAHNIALRDVSFRMNQTGFEDDGCEALLQGTHINRYDIRGCNVGPKALKVAGNHPNLEWLSLSKNPHLAKSMEELGNSTSIKTLLAVAVGMKGLQLTAIARNPELDTVDVSYNNLGDALGKAISDSSVSSLTCVKCNIGDEGVMALVESNTLIEVDISDNPISVESKQVLEAKIRENRERLHYPVQGGFRCDKVGAKVDKAFYKSEAHICEETLAAKAAEKKKTYQEYCYKHFSAMQAEDMSLLAGLAGDLGMALNTAKDGFVFLGNALGGVTAGTVGTVLDLSSKGVGVTTNFVTGAGASALSLFGIGGKSDAKGKGTSKTDSPNEFDSDNDLSDSLGNS